MMTTMKKSPVAPTTEDSRKTTFQKSENTPVTMLPRNSQNVKTDCSIDIFEEAKRRLDILTVVQYYGVNLNRQGFAVCPFHGEKSPSFKVFEQSDSYYCFGCGEGGDAIRFVMRMFNLSSIDAVRQLDTDFMLNLPLNKRLTKAEYIQARIEAEKREDDIAYVAEFELWEAETLMSLSRRFRQLHESSFKRMKPGDPNLQTHVAGLAEMEYVGYLCDTMIQNKHDFMERVEFYRMFGEAVKKYGR